jgi:hypothetical protein
LDALKEAPDLPGFCLAAGVEPLDLKDDPSQLYLMFQVTDTGRGLKGEELPQLFQRFRQGNANTHIEFGGNGLGLPTVAYLPCTVLTIARIVYLQTAGREAQRLHFRRSCPIGRCPVHVLHPR